MLTVKVLNAINIWNELLFALLFILDANMRTLQAGVARFYGFQSTDYALVFAAVAISTLPILPIYFILQRRVSAGLTSIAMD